MMQKSRKAFAMMDLVLTVSLMGLIFLSFTYLTRSEKIKETHLTEQLRLQTLSFGLQQAFDDIVDTYATRLSNVSDTDTQWGWNKENTVSPFPVRTVSGGTPLLRFDLSSGIGAQQLASLKSRIVEYFKGACEDWTARVGGGNDLVLYCQGVTNLTYNLSDGTTGLTRAFVLGSPIEADKTPTAIITYAQEDGLGNFYQNITVEVGYGQVFEKRRAISSNRLAQIRSAMEKFTNAVKLKEIANPQNADGSGGLNNADDEFVGWHWKMFGDNLSNIQTTFCNQPAGGGSCNLPSPNVWRTGTNIRRGLISRRIVNNLLNGDTAYFIDGFGNGIYVYPTAMQCSGSDYMTCAINALPQPADNVAATATSPNIPPFTSIVYTEPFKLKATAGKSYGRVIVTY